MLRQRFRSEMFGFESYELYVLGATTESSIWWCRESARREFWTRRVAFLTDSSHHDRSAEVQLDSAQRRYYGELRTSCRGRRIMAGIGGGQERVRGFIDAI